MNLALVLGENNGNVVKPKLLNIKDNLNVSCFNDIPDFVDKSIKLGSIYDRIIVLPRYIQNGSALKDLYSFWSNTKDTEIVLIAKKGEDEDIANEFLNTFNTPVATTMLVTSTTVHLIAEAVLLSTVQITEKYGIKDFMNIELDETFTSSEEIVDKQEEEKVPEVSNESHKKEKKSLIGALFGGKKNKKQVNNQVQEVQQVSQEVQPESEPQPEPQEIQETQSGAYDSYEDSDSSDDFEYEQPEEDIEEDFISNKEPIEEDFLPKKEPIEEDFITKKEPIEKDFLSKKEPIEEDFLAKKEPIEEDFSSRKEPIEEVDEDFGDLDMETTYDDFSSEPRRKPQIEEVEEDLSELNVTEEESQYREATEQPKVIEKTVVKEVIRDKKGNKVSNTILSGVLDGRYKKIIIVTGDRRTGVTTTALNIAQTFAQSVQVLYFDCDIENHGLLSYIDYNTFRSYERIHMDGVKRCKSSGAFRNCVIQFAHNLDILSTDYTCNANDEDIRDAATVVAENSQDYNVVVVDCPSDKLHLIEELILIGVPILCVEGNKCGFMNMLCRLEASTLPLRYKRSIVSKGTMFLTKTEKGTDIKSLIRFIQDMFEPDGVDWLSMRVVKFSGKLSSKILNYILEG